MYLYCTANVINCRINICCSSCLLIGVEGRGWWGWVGNEGMWIDATCVVFKVFLTCFFYYRSFTCNRFCILCKTGLFEVLDS